MIAKKLQLSTKNGPSSNTLIFQKLVAIPVAWHLLRVHFVSHSIGKPAKDGNLNFKAQDTGSASADVICLFIHYAAQVWFKDQEASLEKTKSPFQEL